MEEVATGLPTISLSGPDVGEQEIEAVLSVFRGGRIALGPRLVEFEKSVADYVGCKHGVAVNSGTSALHIIVRAMGLADGDEVITTPFSFVASANCLLFERAIPKFVDIDPDCARHAEPGTSVEIGDQADPAFLAQLAEKHGPFDIIVDDGGHHVHQQITSFEHLWPHLNDKGYYIVEDTHTSYWPGFGGGFREEKSFIEYAKRLIDKMHSWYTDQDDIFPFDEWARQLQGVRFYDSVTVIEKDLKSEPPLLIGSTNGEITGSRRSLQVRGRRSVFQGRDGT